MVQKLVVILVSDHLQHIFIIMTIRHSFSQHTFHVTLMIYLI